MELYKYTGNIKLVDTHCMNNIFAEVSFENFLCSTPKLLRSIMRNELKNKIKYDSRDVKIDFNIESKIKAKLNLDYKTGVCKIEN